MFGQVLAIGFERLGIGIEIDEDKLRPNANPRFGKGKTAKRTAELVHTAAAYAQQRAAVQAAVDECLDFIRRRAGTGPSRHNACQP